MRRISGFGTNKKQFLIERVTLSICIIPALIIALSPAGSQPTRYSCAAMLIFIVPAAAYIGIYRTYIKKNWYKCKGIFPYNGCFIGVSLWALLPFPPYIVYETKWSLFILMLCCILASIVDYRVYFGLLDEDNPDTDTQQPKASMDAPETIAVDNLRRKSGFGTNKKQFLIERFIVSLCIIPALIIALSPIGSQSAWYFNAAIIGTIIILAIYFYIGVYRMHIKKNWYKCKTIFPLLGSLVGVHLWTILPFPPDSVYKHKWYPFILTLCCILASIVDYRVYFGLLNEDNPDTDTQQQMNKIRH